MYGWFAWSFYLYDKYKFFILWYLYLYKAFVLSIVKCRFIFFELASSKNENWLVFPPFLKLPTSNTWRRGSPRKGILRFSSNNLKCYSHYVIITWGADCDIRSEAMSWTCNASIRKWDCMTHVHLSRTGKVVRIAATLSVNYVCATTDLSTGWHWLRFRRRLPSTRTPSWLTRYVSA